MDTFEGKCVGGPWDGKMLAHTSKRKELLRPVPDAVPVVIGEYRMNDYGQWHWWGTPEGEALNVLYGEVSE